MANGWYEAGLRAFANGNIDWVNDDIRVALIDTGVYTVDLVNHDFKDDLSGIVDDMAASLAGKAVSGAGVLDSNDPTYTAVTGATVEALVVYKFNAVPASAQLLFYVDSATANLPFTPNGSDVTIQVNASGWAAL
jgi:hypothetical protein